MYFNISITVEHIAFSATNGKTVSKTIIFGSVKLNLGNAYSDSTGVFTAPYPGIYAFFWTIATDNKKNCDTELSINNSGTYRSMV
ncbi:hypothetical protein FSP39_020042 [Pinctada imbricata]|uniref:C1q domain-containing protein n=1 Tax=Pinctada imbricata TaxID=66713 RepID=A0AA88XGE6_PINIB|nr:hypothetical protein FSP39_020042 [Pinctada imbricata]